VALLALTLVGAVIVAWGGWAWWSSRWHRLAEGAIAAEGRADWPEAARAWNAYNLGPYRSGDTLRAEARAELASGRARRAEAALIQACEADPGAAEAWRLRLQVLRLEDRAVEALRVGEEALRAVPPSSRREVLRDLTLALLAEPPPDRTRATLASWIKADPTDLDALAALRRLMARDPRDGDPTRTSRIDELQRALDAEPAHAGVREALVLDLADAGRTDRGRALLDGWPEATRDARHDRLRGRWALDFDRDPERAATALRKAVDALPHDWHTRYQLARALRRTGHPQEAQDEAERVARLRELLDPQRLGPRLEANLAPPHDITKDLDMSDLCEKAGLTGLGEAWRREPQDRLPHLDGEPQRAGQGQ
jgi:tetratricopeptide (TPR) repeat protein